MLKPPRGFSPWEPTIPPGSYDPSLDATERGAQRGYDDLLIDTEKSGQRAESQREIDTGTVGRGRDRGLADTLRARTRGQQDFAERRDDTSRGFRQLGDRQADAAASQGVAGSLAASLAARTANEGREQADINESEGRFLEDSRLVEGRLNEDADLSIADINRLFGYGEVDRAEGTSRAGRELGFFQTDTGEQRAFQAGQSGRLPGRGEPGGIPSNEFEDDRGPYRLILRDGRKIRVRPDGSEEDAGRSSRQPRRRPPRASLPLAPRRRT